MLPSLYSHFTIPCTQMPPLYKIADVPESLVIQQSQLQDQSSYLRFSNVPMPLGFLNNCLFQSKLHLNTIC